jgi:hypothetical protein
MLRKSNLALGALAVAMLAPVPSQAQLWTWTKEQLTEYTKAWTGERFPDGRPKVPDNLIVRARGMSQEEININWAAGAPAPAPGTGIGGGRGGAGGGGGRGTPYSQYEDGWIVVHPGKKMHVPTWTAWS